MIFSKKPQDNMNDDVRSDEASEVLDSSEQVADEQALEQDQDQDKNQGQGETASTQRIPSKPSIISEGFEFVGTITSQGTLNIAGIVKGKITANTVLIDIEGQVEGELNADMLMVKGRVLGDVKCRDLNIGPRALVDGNISYQNIHIQRGGKVAGKFNKS
jgi:cytoskeletal protein CcmA (bactofilin family)